MRGKGKKEEQAPYKIGITPAYAGKRKTMKILVLETQDHPRLCGEKLSFPLPIVRVMGSPPPMRGKAEEETSETTETGITPAYAGKSDFISRD